MTENHDRIERTLEVLLYAPLGFGLFMKDSAPTFINMFVSRGRAEVDRRHEEVQRHVTTARSLGQVTMAFGPPLVRERVSRTVADARRRAEELLGTTATDAEAEPAADTATPPVDTEPAARRFTPVSEESSPTVAPTRPAPAPASAPGESTSSESPGAASFTSEPMSNGDPAHSAVLPIPGYDALSASQVVERLVGLAPEELDAVHQYEASHRQRRTILGKIEQLAG
jgi:hypothetical protein